jgi:PAS domain-containing protein
MADSTSKTLPAPPAIAPHAVLHVAQAERRHAILAARAERSKSLRDVVTALLSEWNATIEHLRLAAERVDEYQTWASLAEREYHALAVQTDALFNLIPVACIRTNEAGIIVKTNDAAAALLATSPRHLVGRQLAYHVEDRDSFSRLLTIAGKGERAVQADVTVRPRERRRLVVSLTGRASDDGEIVWILDDRPSPARSTPLPEALDD